MDFRLLFFIPLTTITFCRVTKKTSFHSFNSIQSTLSACANYDKKKVHPKDLFFAVEYVFLEYFRSIFSLPL